MGLGLSTYAPYIVATYPPHSPHFFGTLGDNSLPFPPYLSTSYPHLPSPSPVTSCRFFRGWGCPSPTLAPKGERHRGDFYPSASALRSWAGCRREARVFDGGCGYDGLRADSLYHPSTNISCGGFSVILDHHSSDSCARLLSTSPVVSMAGREGLSYSTAGVFLFYKLYQDYVDVLKPRD